MDLADVVRALMDGNLLTAREFAADVHRSHMQWDSLERPVGLSERELSVAAAIVELLAWRNDSRPPSWTADVGAAPELMVLDPGLEQMPRSFARAKEAGPESLRKRNLIAPPDFLHVA